MYFYKETFIVLDLYYTGQKSKHRMNLPSHDDACRGKYIPEIEFVISNYYLKVTLQASNVMNNHSHYIHDILSKEVEQGSIINDLARIIIGFLLDWV